MFYASNISDASTSHHDVMYVRDERTVETYGSGNRTRITLVQFNSDYGVAERFLSKTTSTRD